MKPLNIFYKEPDPDRWLPYDRYPRKIIRRIIRGPRRPGGQELVALNLMKGLDKLGIPYRFNDFKHIGRNPKELACIIGKPNLLFERKWQNPILFGASVFSHPIEHPNLFTRFPNIQKILVPGNWIKEMFEPFYPGRVESWPTGIDTEEWNPKLKQCNSVDFLIYDKIRWEYDSFIKELLDPIKSFLSASGYSFEIIRYMYYSPGDLKEKLSKCRACIFLCEHETQGLAYQQILSTGTPIFAWDRGGYWQDPELYPDKVKFEGVSSVPYWNESCGEKFKDINEFKSRIETFIKKLNSNFFDPRSYIIENLSLESCSQQYCNIVKSLL